MQAKVLQPSAVLILVIALWLVAHLMGGSLGVIGFMALVMIGWVCILIMVLIAGRLSPPGPTHSRSPQRSLFVIESLTGRSNHRGRVYIGLFMLATLFLPDSVIAAVLSRLWQPFEDPSALAFLLIFPVSLIVTALLLHSGFSLWEHTGNEADTEAQRKQNRRTSAVLLCLSVLVLAKTLHDFYWRMVWDNTYDPLGYLWLLLPLLAVLCACTAMLIAPAKPTRPAVFLTLLVIPVLIAVSTYAQSVDFRRLTEARAEGVSRALAAYYAHEGHYPQNLRQLTPWYSISLPGPVIIYGQDWCYQGGQDYYRLGYLSREHWSSPILFGKVYSTAGLSPLQTDVCQSAIDTYRAHHPDWEQVLHDYGRPTPTPDLGD